MNTKRAAIMLKDFGSHLNNDELSQLLQNIDMKKLGSRMMELGAPFNPREAQIFAQIVGKMDDDHDFEKHGHMWRDDILDKYADFVHNYEYQYNDKALEVNPNEDLNQKHIGPMADDLEKVNAATVKVDEGSGYKTVDTGRLALMNAGAIADLAREIKELKHVTT